MEHSKIVCYSIIEHILTSPISATNELFLDLCTSVEALMNDVSSCFGKIQSNYHQNIKFSILLKCYQIISSLKFLATIIQKEQKIGVILKQCRKIACDRIKFCFDLIEKPSPENEKDINDFGLFLRWMDEALAQVDQIDIDEDRHTFLIKLKNTKSLYEDILAHAMSLAQICMDDDKDIIYGSCRSVLDILNDLEKELNKDNPHKAMVSLFIEDASNKLCSLERRVDISILKLSLHVFSQYCVTIDSLHTFCETNYNKPLAIEEAEDIICHYDLHVDRIFQIGLFAVFCSSNITSGTAIKNCMANLEFIEPELIPALKMLLKDSSEQRKASALIFKDYWISEANKLKTLIYEIIDPSAFCKVIYDEVALEIQKIIESYDEKEEPKQGAFVNIFNFGKVLIEFLVTVVRIESISDDQLKDRIRKCHLITLEIGAGIDVLKENNTVTTERLLKRSKILQAQIKKILFLLKGEIKENIEEEKYSVNLHEEKQELVDHNSFSKIMCRGKEILQNRSIMYRTPKKFEKPHLEVSGNPKLAESLMKGLSHPLFHFSFRSLDEPLSLNRTNIENIFNHLSELKSEFNEK